MQEQKKYHQRKLAIIEMISKCDGFIKYHENMTKVFFFNSPPFIESMNGVNKYEKIKKYLNNKLKFITKHEIHKVNHNYLSFLVHVCCLVDYFVNEDTVLQLNYSSEYYARKDKQHTTVGMWRVKPTDKLNH